MKILKVFFVSVLLFLSSVPMAYSASCDPEVNKGLVKRVYPTIVSALGSSSGTYFTISGTTAALTAPTGYYFIPSTADNIMKDLLLEAAKSQRVIYVRTLNCSGVTTTATVAYLYVNF